MSDIEFLAIKEFDGKRVDADGTVSIGTTVETDVVTVTAGGGNDMYLGEASFHADVTNGVATSDLTARLYANGVEIETKIWRNLATGSNIELKFITKGEKVATGQIIKITIQASSGTMTITNFGKLVLFEETTGESPQIA